MLLLRRGVGATLPERSCPEWAATCLSKATAASSCNVELLDQLDSNDSLPWQTQSHNSAGTEGQSSNPRKHKKCNFFVKEGKLLRFFGEVLNTVISPSDEFHGTCGSRLEGLTSGCTIHVLRRLRDGARAGGAGNGCIFGSGSVWHAVLIGVGLPTPVATGVINPVVPSTMLVLAAHQHMPLCCSLDAFSFPLIVVVLLLLPWSLGWCSVPLESPGGKAPQTTRVADVETMLLKQKMLRETERNIVELDDTVADL